MAKVAADPKVLSVVEALQSTLVNNLAPFVFYNDPTLGKCLARVSGFPGERSPVVRDGNENIVSGGQILFWLSVDHNNGGTDFKVKCAYDGSGKAGTFRLANDGDLADHVNMAKLKVDTDDTPVGDDVGADPGTPGERPQSNTAVGEVPITAPLVEPEFDERDTNKDGTVSPKEQKRYDKDHQ